MFRLARARPLCSSSRHSESVRAGASDRTGGTSPASRRPVARGTEGRDRGGLGCARRTCAWGAIRGEPSGPLGNEGRGPKSHGPCHRHATRVSSAHSEGEEEMMETKGSPPVMVSLHDVVVEMDLLNDEWTAYLNRRTGELVTVTDDDARLAVEDEEAADLPDWQQERLPKVREVLGSDDFLVLPDKDEINEYGIMEDFCLGLEDPALRDALLGAIRGSGAFR